MTYNETKERRARSKRRWNFIGFALLILGISAPVGVGVLIANAMDILPNIGGSVDLKRAIQDMDVKGPVNAPVAEVPEQKKRDNGMPKHGALITAIGAIVTALGVVGAISTGLEMLEYGFSFTGLISPVVNLCIAAG